MVWFCIAILMTRSWKCTSPFILDDGNPRVLKMHFAINESTFYIILCQLEQVGQFLLLSQKCYLSLSLSASLSLFLSFSLSMPPPPPPPTPHTQTHRRKGKERKKKNLYILENTVNQRTEKCLKKSFPLFFCKSLHKKKSI